MFPWPICWILASFSSCCQLGERLSSAFMSFVRSGMCLDAAESYKGRCFSRVKGDGEQRSWGRQRCVVPSVRDGHARPSTDTEKEWLLLRKTTVLQANKLWSWTFCHMHVFLKREREVEANLLVVGWFLPWTWIQSTSAVPLPRGFESPFVPTLSAPGT